MSAPYSSADGEGELLSFSGAEFIVKASGKTTDGAFSIIEERNPLDTPRHVHANEDELFVVLEGEHIFVVGDETFHAGPGAVIYAPRRIPHEHRRVVSRSGRFLTMMSPPGFEGFFYELSEAERSGASMDGAYARVSAKYGIRWT